MAIQVAAGKIQLQSKKNTWVKKCGKHTRGSFSPARGVRTVFNSLVASVPALLLSCHCITYKNIFYILRFEDL
jgi:hypothetical protein